ncbi:MAG: hypothetical protein OEU50_14885 [Gammaproteobacteria bacterium]|nr:hypothetical protein [Gammaproteobacteria bacterium]
MMPGLSSFSVRLGLVATLLAALAAVQVADYGSLVEKHSKSAKEPAQVTVAMVEQIIDQYAKGYDFNVYRNVIDNSNFAVNPVKKEEPVKVVMPEPKPEPPPPQKSKPKPFTANLEVTGIAITPERKLVMVWDKVKKQTHVLRESEKLYKWRVVAIDSQRVVLRHPLGGRYEFIVNEDTLVDSQN